MAVEEDLTPVERLLCHYLNLGLTAQEIATDRWVTLNTVKSQMLRLYRKLGVHGRADAVARARALGVLQ